MAVFGMTARYAWLAVPIGGFLLGKYLDDQETLRMTSFRDKSKLYGDVTGKREKPSWP